jgi:hypothetical protein
MLEKATAKVGTSALFPLTGILRDYQACHQANRVAFKDKAEIDQYRSRFCANTHMEQVWQCEICKHWHYIGWQTGPSGKDRHDTLLIPVRTKAWLVEHGRKLIDHVSRARGEADAPEKPTLAPGSGLF